MTLDTQAPSPFAGPTARGGYPQGYGGGGPAGYAQGYANTDYAPASAGANAFAGGTGDAVIAEARKTHSRGALIYLFAWIVIAVSVPVLFGGIGLAVSALSLTGTGEELLLSGLGLLCAGLAIRGAGFSLMMKADFAVRVRVWTGGK